MEKQTKWYHQIWILIAGFLTVGPFVLPLLWSNPHISTKAKVFWSIVAVILTVIITIVFGWSVKKILDYAQSLL
jgi:hypothetical protein